METQAKSPWLSPLVDLFDLHTTFFLRAIEGISDKDAHNRLDTKANHVAWLAGSLVQQRFELARDLSNDRDSFSEKQQAHELFSDNKGIIDSAVYPSLSQFERDWQRITPIFRDGLMNADEAKLRISFDMGDGVPMTIYQLISFVAYREANIIGQIALWRRLLGYTPLRYM